MRDKRVIFLENVLIPLAEIRLHQLRKTDTDYERAVMHLDELKLEYRERTGAPYLSSEEVAREYARTQGLP